MLILVGGQKGGTGKSTIATNLVVMRALDKRDAFLFDIDDQKTSTIWASLRDENNISPRIPSTQKLLDEKILSPGTVIRNELKALSTKHDDIIIDAGGANNEVLRSALTLTDIAIFPLIPSAFDMWTVRTLNELVGEAQTFNPKLKAFVHYNKVSQHPQLAQTEIEASDDLLNDYTNLKRLKKPMVLRASVRKAQSEGLAIVEYKPVDDKALEEIKTTYKEVFDGQ